MLLRIGRPGDEDGGAWWSASSVLGQRCCCIGPLGRRPAVEHTSAQEDIMIEVVPGFPNNIAAFACHGHVTKADYETVLVPDIEKKLEQHDKVTGRKTDHGGARRTHARVA